jgi:hypothetical protein
MDLNVRAFRVVQAATSEHKEPTEANDPKKAAARKGGLLGGPSRARSMSARRRREIARAASNARWHKAARKTERQGT